MKHSLIMLWSLVVTIQALPEDAQTVNECMACHLEQDEEYALPAEMFTKDVHFLKGFTCADCHGGDPTTDDFDEAKEPDDPDLEFIGVPEQEEVPGVCARCHADPVFMQKYDPAMPVDQVPKYWSSQHGMSLAAGDTTVATCRSCHGTHGILPTDDTRSLVYPTNVATTCNSCHGDQDLMLLHGDTTTSEFTDYSASVHGKALTEEGDLSAPTCNDCHGNHGAIPPGVTSVKMICGQCHMNNQEIFEQTKMSKVIENKGLHGCVICHGNHRILNSSDEMISAEDGICFKCHQPGDRGARQAELIRSVLSELIISIDQAEKKVREAENLGIDMNDALFDIQKAQEVLTKSRTMIHSLDGREVQISTVPGLKLSNSAQEVAVEAIGEFRTRRVGLGVATILITFLAVMLYAYIRRLEKNT